MSEEFPRKSLEHLAGNKIDLKAYRHRLYEEVQTAWRKYCKQQPGRREREILHCAIEDSDMGASTATTVASDVLALVYRSGRLELCIDGNCTDDKRLLGDCACYVLRQMRLPVNERDVTLSAVMGFADWRVDPAVMRRVFDDLARYGEEDNAPEGAIDASVRESSILERISKVYEGAPALERDFLLYAALDENPEEYVAASIARKVRMHAGRGRSRRIRMELEPCSQLIAKLLRFGIAAISSENSTDRRINLETTTTHIIEQTGKDYNLNRMVAAMRLARRDEDSFIGGDGPQMT